MTMTIPLRISLDDIETIRRCTRKCKGLEAPADLGRHLDILNRILATAYQEVNAQQNTLEAFSQALEYHLEASHG